MRYMDYDDFKKEYEAFDEWNKDNSWDYNNDWLENSKKWRALNQPLYNQASLEEGRQWLRARDAHLQEMSQTYNEGDLFHPFGQSDMVNSPAHYTRGTQEAIDIIEEAIQDAPDVKSGMLQAQALKYLLRLWLKGNAPQDSQKANWYLTRLIEHLKETD